MNETDVVNRVTEILAGRYDVRHATSVPSSHELSHSNRAVKFPAVVFAADIRDSSWMLDEHQQQTVAKLHRAFLYVVAECVRDSGGKLRSFDGDGLLAFWHDNGSEAAQNAVGAALKAYALWNGSLRSRISRYRDVEFGAAITRGSVLAVKAGLEGGQMNSTTVWVDDSVNLAVKMAKQARSPQSLLVTTDVWQDLELSDRYEKPDAWIFKEPLWDEMSYTYRDFDVDIRAFSAWSRVTIHL